jgi:hypothetical protein
MLSITRFGLAAVTVEITDAIPTLAWCALPGGSN